MDEICPKRIFVVENERNEHHHWILDVRISLSIKFYLKLTISIFGPNLPKKGIFYRKRKKWTASLNCPNSNYASHQIQLKEIIFNFWIKLAQKGYFWSKTKKANSIIEFCILELDYLPNLALKRQFWDFGPNLPKMGVAD